MIPLVVCTLGSPSLAVLEASVKTYAPELHLWVADGRYGSFGADYNDAMARAFSVSDEILIANDDIVLKPDTIKILMEDVQALKNAGVKVGLVGVHSDMVRPLQDIRRDEGRLKEVPVLSPILAWVPKEAFDLVKFPPINWFSDDVMCLDLLKEGFRHFVSRAYVHHAGSQTVGTDNRRLAEDARGWVTAHRPEYAKAWYA